MHPINQQALAFHKESRFSESLATLKEAVQNGLGDEETRACLAALYCDLGYYKQAEETWTSKNSNYATTKENRASHEFTM